MTTQAIIDALSLNCRRIPNHRELVKEIQDGLRKLLGRDFEDDALLKMAVVVYAMTYRYVQGDTQIRLNAIAEELIAGFMDPKVKQIYEALK